MGELHARLPESDVDYVKWESRMLSAVEAQKGAPPEEAIPALGKWLHQLGIPQNRERGERPVFQKVQEALLSIPGHAEYYGNRIVEPYRAVKRSLGDPDTYSPALAKYQTESLYGFDTLRHLPSPETVRVLGDMLSEEWRNPIPIQDGMKENPLAHYALRALAQLPLESKPAQTSADDHLEKDLRSWQLWYEQVKAGTRTFRFKGDPKEYSLRGDRAAVIDGGPGGRSRTRPAEEPAAVPEEPGEGAPVAVIAIAGLLVLLSALFFFRGRKMTTAR